MKEIIDALKKKTKLKEIKLEIPPEGMGDYAFPCFLSAKILKKNPVEIAKELSSIKIKGVEVKVEGPYLNFFLNKSIVAEKAIKEIMKGKKRKKLNKLILVEYPGPNTNKPLHLGHVRNIVLGKCLINLNSGLGYTVKAVNINNDRGVHICKSMLAYEKWGKDDTPEKSKLKSDFFVGKYYVLFNQKLKKHPELEKEAQEMLEKWEKEDKKVRALWAKMNKWAFDGFKETYKKFGVKFDKEYYESETYQKGKDMVLKGLKKGIFQKAENGAVVVDLGKYGEKALLRANGTSVYVTQDMYTAVKRYEDYKFDKLIYIVATEQNYHFKVLFTLLKKLGYKFNLEHYAYGMVHLTSGKMKSREGNVVDADNLVEELTSIAYLETKKRHPELKEKEIQRRATVIGMGAIRFYLLKYESLKDILFNPKESLSFEGETGPYVQYVYARISSILRKEDCNGKVDYSLLKTEEEEKLISLLSKYDSVVTEASTKLRPHLIARYCLNLGQAFNNFYHKHSILQADTEIKKARIILIKAVREVIRNSLKILDIEVLEEM